jgi:L-aspartate oxidase
MDDLLETDVLIIGCGIAGSTAALQLAEKGIPVTVVTRAQAPEESNTLYAQGGIVYKGVEDTPELLVDDVLAAGAGHSYRPAVELMAAEGPALVEEILIEKVATPFDRHPDGTLATIREGAHSRPRIIHAADSTGRAIQLALIKALQQHENIQCLTGHTAVDLLTPSHHAKNRLAVYEPRKCVGAYVLDEQQDIVLRIVAKRTILASGGVGQVYLRSTNPLGARGDGIAMANRAGARIINAEFIQFHPTTFHKPPAPHFLISEAVRGAGARLVHADGRPFMQEYDAEWKDLAPRDVVSRAIHREMLERDLANVFLDLRSYIPESTIRQHFPNISDACQQHGIDIIQDLVPVVPGAHYFCGGIWVDEWGRSTVDNLYAVGEVSCTGVHGANRLASTSLLEGVVWGNRAAHHIHESLDDLSSYDPNAIPLWEHAPGEKADPALVAQDMRTIQHIMWNYVGLVRTIPRLARAIRELRHLETEIEQFYRATRLSDSLVGLRSAVRTAIIITLAAWGNKRSMGTHYRE